MDTLRYTGAYSRRRYSNFTAASDQSKAASPLTAEQSASSTNVTLRVDYDHSLGRVTAAGLSDGSVTVPKGTQVMLEATPISNATFAGWTADFRMPAGAATTNPLNITVNAQGRIKAVFTSPQSGNDPIVVDPHVVNPNGQVTPDKPNGKLGSGSLVDSILAFAKKYWWALLIAAYIIYKEGARK